MSSWKSLLLSFFGGGVAFWIPDVVIPALNHKEQGTAVTIACPALLMAFYLAVLRLRKTERSGPSSALFAICGVWLLALSFSTLAQTVRGNGFTGGRWTWNDFGYLLVSSFLPTRIVEFVMLEGSVIALCIGTIAMLVCHIAFERTRWVTSPSLFAAVKLGGSARNQ